MVQLRDVIQKRQKGQDKKQDIRGRYRAVLTDSQGNQTSDTPLIDVWANQTTRRVWHMPLGASQPSQVFCQNISNPYVGLPVECGYEESNNTIEVLRVDQLPAKVGGDPTGYDQNDPAAFEPGGIKMMWLYAKAITPLATWPTSTGLTVNINAGDYPYLGVRKTFPGQTALPLTQNPNPGEHYFAGLYLDSANTLQVVYGASVVTTTNPPPEPAWPAGAFLLSVVRINDTQTSIILGSDTSSDNDIFDRRMLWSDEQSGTSAASWPYDNIYTVSAANPNADYSSIAAAVAAVPEDSLIVLDVGPSSGQWNESFTLATNGVGIVGWNKKKIVITNAADTVTITGSGCALYNLTIINTAAADSHYALTVDGPLLNVQDCIIAKFSAATLGAGIFHKSGTGLILNDVDASSTDSASNYGYYNITNIVDVKIFGGSYEGNTADIFSSVAGSSAKLLLPPNLVNGLVSHAGTITGRYTDATGNLRWLTTTGETLGVWLEDISTGLRTYYSTLAAAITAAASGDIIRLQAGTYGPAVVTLNKDITLKGSAHGDTIITNNSGTTTLTVSAAGARVEDITVVNSSTGNAVDVTAATATLERVIAQTIAAAGSVKSAIATTSSAKCTLIACEAEASGGSLSNAALLVTSTAICEVIGGKYNGSAIDASCASGNTLTLIDPVFVNATLTTGGTIRGQAYDQYGRRLRLKPIGVNDGRLTLTTDVPVTTADVTAATTIYYTPYVGGKCEVYNGSFWIEAPFTQLSLALTSFAANKNSDMWIYDNAGTLALERTEWTNDTTRATALAYQDGRYCKSGTLTRLYLGTFRTTGTTGQCEDSTTKRYVWNNYNRVPRVLRVYYSSSSHTYNTATVRAYNNNQANSDTEFVAGLIEDAFTIHYYAAMTFAAGNSTPYIGMGVNTTAAFTAIALPMALVGTLGVWGSYATVPRLGYNFLCLVEYSTATGTAPTWQEAASEAAILL